MENFFSRASGPVVHRRLKTEAAVRFSPSYAVHKGLIRDPNWPPAHFPEEGNAASRRARRIGCNLIVAAGPERFDTWGDLSLGGAMFMLPKRCAASLVTITVGLVSASAEIIAATPKDSLIAHHVRFTDPSEGAEIWAGLISL